MRASQLRVVVLDHTAALGGAEIALVRLLAERPADADAHVVLLQPGPLAEALLSAGVPVSVLPLDASVQNRPRSALLGSPLGALRTVGTSAAFARRLARLLRRLRPDLVVTNSLKAAVFAWLVAPLVRRPWVWHLHDRLARDYLPPAVVLLLRLLAAHGPRMIVANSEATRATLPPAAAPRTVVAYPGLRANEIRAREELPPASAVVGILGRLSETKGQREFLQAAAQVAARHPDVGFRVIGTALFNDQGYADALPDLCRALGIENRVEFSGWRPDPVAELRSLSVAVHASPVPEPFGQVVLEAMANEVPVVASLAGGVPEIVDPGGGLARSDRVVHGAYGLLVRPGDVDALADAVSWLLDHPVEARETAVRARAWVASQFSIDGTVAAVTEAWRRAAGQRP